ncbi:hypothetical protein SLS55_006825 [Diplodia seriata]|uniref:Heterokaryon incompatibility domain-containing protein n=1 Tax=Diplodia seriata TaxID=420778 RepID=A0ABR3CAM5_9PEZI
MVRQRFSLPRTGGLNKKADLTFRQSIRAPRPAQLAHRKSSVTTTAGAATRTAMDHLLVPKDPIRSPPRICYYCLEEYDRGDFITYPERQGWTQEELFTRTTWTEVDSVGGRGAAAAAAFLQQWLFFGLLHTALGDDLIFEDYIEEESGTKYVHTRNLFVHADELVEKRNTGLVLESDMYPLDRAIHTAFLALAFIRKMPGDALDSYFILSLSLMGRFMTCLRQILFRDGDLDSTKDDDVWEPPRIRAEAGWWEHGSAQDDSISILAHEMFKEEWCPRAISILQGNFGGLECRYLASLLRNFQKGRISHQACTQTQCFASQIQKSSYQTVHTSAGCDCHFRGFDSKAVEKILEAGHLPLVVWNRRDETLSLISGQFSATYVALSHVWSDGLGNPHENAMPQCQLEAIDGLVRDLNPDDAEQIPFWIDTLCCPTGSSDARRIAIQKMRDTYAGANKVLVLDSTLRSISTTGRSVAELALYIYSSSWAARLWTFQEGALPDRLIFQFSDATLDSKKILSTAEGFEFNFKNGWGSAYDVYRIFVQIRGNNRHFEHSDNSNIINFEWCAIAFSKRTTSVQDDEALCLASLTDQDPGPLLNSRGQDRMKQFWSQLTNVSEKWMYHTLSRLDLVGFRWAPRTLLGAGTPGGYHDSRATPTSRGLLVSAYSITFQSPQPPLSYPIGCSFWVRSTDDDWTFYLLKNIDLSPAHGPDAFTIPSGHFSRIAVLMTETIRNSGFDGDRRFVMVFVTEEEGGVTYARRGDSGIIRKADHPRNRGLDFHIAMMEGKERLIAQPQPDSRVSREGKNYLADDEYATVIGDWTDEKSQWCID